MVGAPRPSVLQNMSERSREQGGIGGRGKSPGEGVRVSQQGSCRPLQGACLGGGARHVTSWRGWKARLRSPAEEEGHGEAQRARVSPGFAGGWRAGGFHPRERLDGHKSFTSSGKAAPRMSLSPPMTRRRAVGQPGPLRYCLSSGRFR